MNIDIEDMLFINEYNQLKSRFFKKVELGYRAEDVKQMREMGITDDSIFIAQLIVTYKGCIETLGMDI